MTALTLKVMEKLLESSGIWTKFTWPKFVSTIWLIILADCSSFGCLIQTHCVWQTIDLDAWKQMKTEIRLKRFKRIKFRKILGQILAFKPPVWSRNFQQKKLDWKFQKSLDFRLNYPNHPWALLFPPIRVNRPLKLLGNPKFRIVLPSNWCGPKILTLALTASGLKSRLSADHLVFFIVL